MAYLGRFPEEEGKKQVQKDSVDRVRHGAWKPLVLNQFRELFKNKGEKGGIFCRAGAFSLWATHQLICLAGNSNKKNG